MDEDEIRRAYARWEAGEISAHTLGRMCALEGADPSWDGPWLNSSEVAQVTGLQQATWNGYASRGQAPPAERVDCGIKQWRRTTIEAWDANRPRKPGRPRKITQPLGEVS